MEIQFKNILLRDMKESDIEDYVRWFTTETQWMDWDAPWEIDRSDANTERRSWTEYYESMREMPDDVPRWKFEIDCEGSHIGWVSSYLTDENYEWISARQVKNGQNRKGRAPHGSVVLGPVSISNPSPMPVVTA